MNGTDQRNLIITSGLVTTLAIFILLVGSASDVTSIYGATRPIPYTFDIGAFNITDVSIKDGDYSTNLIGFIENTDPSLRTIKGVSLKIEIFDRDNHLIDVADSGFSSLPSTFQPNTKSAFKIPIDKNDDLDHINIQILATDWGTPTYAPSSENQSSNGPYIGIEGMDLTPNIAESIGSNQTEGVLVTAADDFGLPIGTQFRSGDIIKKIDNTTVSNMGDLNRYVIQKQVNDVVHLTVIRDNSTKEFDFQLAAPTRKTLNDVSNTPINGNNSPEDLYNQCVYVSGKSLCDFLFKK